MKQAFIEIKNLKFSPLNVRKHGDKSGEDLIPSIRARGIVQPRLVRPNCEGFEVLAGQRRFNAASSIAKEQDIEPIPCLIMEEGDDAAAIEASLAENIARLPMDELDQYEAFRALQKEGRSIEGIAFAFGVTERMVKQRLALANLHPPILNAFRRDEISADNLRNLTMATKKLQKEWWRLFTTEGENAPNGRYLKSWLFGGDEISVSNALFDLESYKGTLVSDLFQEERYFADSTLFWEHQSKAIAELVEEYTEEGWQAVVVHDVGEYLHKYECVKVAKEDGGEVHITCASNGEITINAGYLDEKTYNKQAKAKKTGEAVENTRPELTNPMQNYLALHRHAAVRSELLSHQGVALRLAVAQMIAESVLWTVNAEAQKANNDAIEESLSSSQTQAGFDETRKQIKAMLGIDDKHPTLVNRRDDWGRPLDAHALFAKLETFSDDEVMQILTFVVAETLTCGSEMVEGLGEQLKVDMRQHWTPDQTFFDLMRDKEAINAMVGEIGGKKVASVNVTSTTKVQKQIVQDFMNGENGREKTDWQPRYMRFPMEAYTKRGGIDAIRKYKAVRKHYVA